MHIWASLVGGKEKCMNTHFYLLNLKIAGIEYREKDVCIRVSVDGKDYVIFMLAACYGNKWYLVQFYNEVSSLLGMNAISGGMGKYDLLVK